MAEAADRGVDLLHVLLLAEEDRQIQEEIDNLERSRRR